MASDLQTEYHRYQQYTSAFNVFYRQKKVRAYTELVLSILAINFFLFFAIKPTVLTITNLIRNINDQKLVAQKLGEKINSLNLAQTEHNSIQADIYLIDEAFPKQPLLTNLLKQLEILAQNSGLTLESNQFTKISFKEEKPIENQESFTFNLTLAGDYQNMKKFLEDLSSLRRIILVENFSVRAVKAETISLSLNLSSKTFYGEAGK